MADGRFEDLKTTCFDVTSVVTKNENGNGAHLKAMMVLRRLETRLS